MNIEKFLEFWSKHNIVIIEVVFGLILIMIIYLAFRIFFSQEEEHTQSGGISPDLEKSLQKLISGMTTEGMHASTVSISDEHDGGSISEKDNEIKLLKDVLKAKESEISSLKENSKAASSEDSSGEMKKLKDLVKNLEERLAEYEIIADDIADISKFKEENSKLQTEIDTLKNQLASSGASASAPVSSLKTSSTEALNNQVDLPATNAPAQPVAVMAPVEEPMDQNSIDALLAQPAEQTVVSAQAPVAEDSPAASEMDDLEREFQALVEAQKAGTLAQQETSVDVNAGVDPNALAAQNAAEQSYDPQSDVDALLAQHSVDNVENTQKEKDAESGKLLGDFEKFIDKKGG